jgi:hypothetical protein
LRRTLADREAAFARLKTQLADVATAKRAHEDALLSKFAALLNAKKRKVRDLQRILAGASFDAAEAGTAPRSGRAAPRGTKRKGEAGDDDDDQDDDDQDDEKDDETEASTDQGSESDDAFEDVGGPTPKRQPKSVVAREAKRDASPPPTPAPAPKVRHAIGGKKRQPAAAVASPPAGVARKKDDADVPMGGVDVKVAPDAPPPRRELPFMRPAVAEKPAAPADDEDDDETDDEL